ncbi:hypothetical protein HZ993_06880 [Rhodoferax sp. AJA081-3]|uniref:hypothetical protein n=1 Tax=Rhodoferax sp. AJA081-3 TaxID=2752316 RepID=UPI001AE0801D|nr:hypothetical protein [Rhodoferax sp. AJA081-3]QTN29536.1 hypothetical protein HZ993_06880 [Rhodoferax sp. AJA081-3]
MPRIPSIAHALTLCALALLCLPPMATAAEKLKTVVVRQALLDLTVELRQVKEGEEDQDNPEASGGAYTVGTANRAVDFAPQQVRVRNGEKASLQINQSMPMQWVQKIESQSATLSAAGTSASSNSGGVTQAVTWMESGQSLTVKPQWPGGKLPVKIEIEVQSSAVDERTSADLPATQRQRYTSTVSAPLNRWVTIASSGKPARAGSYSSAGSSDGRRLMQIRVSREP